jgi:hypothetical protein
MTRSRITQIVNLVNLTPDSLTGRSSGNCAVSWLAAQP